MQSIINFRLDQMIREGIEHLPTFWDLKTQYLRMIELEYEFERGRLAGEMNEFHRRCVDNDKPGRRHMLPFCWAAMTSFDGGSKVMQVPIKVGTHMYEKRMASYKARMAELKRRTPNYG